MKNIRLIYLSSLIMFSLVGVYIFPQYGIRSDHIIIYSLLSIYIFLFIINFSKVTFNLHVLNLVILFLIFLLIGSLQKISGSVNTDFLKFMSQFENFFQPIAIMIVTCFSYSAANKFYSHNQILIGTMEIILIFLIFNSIFAMFALYYGPGDYLTYFSGAPDEGRGFTTNVLALNVGRSTGVFSQPFDAGIAYSIGLLTWAYLFEKREYITFKKLYFFGFPILLIGSFISGSKVVQFVGIILFLFYLLLNRNVVQVILNKKIILLILIGIILLYFIIIYWEGAIPLSRTFQYFIFNRIF